MLAGDRAFQVWPFEGDLTMLLKSDSIIVGEIYPRAAYSTALLDGPVELRPPLSLEKTAADHRRSAIEALTNSEWVRGQRVSFENLDCAQANEDDFDACITAAALLRCELEGLPFCAPWLEIDRVEGGMLGTGSMNLALKERRWRSNPSKVQRTHKQPSQNGTRETVVSRKTTSLFRCPIADCDKVYVSTRGGWDSHVGSLRNHPFWHPELVSAEERKEHFAIEFPDFFARTASDRDF